MSFDLSYAHDRSQSHSTSPAAVAVPGKRTNTEHLVAASSSGRSRAAPPSDSHSSAGTSWLHGVLGFGEMSGEADAGAESSELAGDAEHGELTSEASGEASGEAFGEASEESSGESVESDDGGGSEPAAIESDAADARDTEPGAATGKSKAASKPASKPEPKAGGAAAGAAAAGKPTIRSQTVKQAPDGTPATRDHVGVGELVKLTSNTSGDWTANHGSSKQPDSSFFYWKAPSTPCLTTIRFKAGGKTLVKRFRVEAPKQLQFRIGSEDSYPSGQQGAGMRANLTIGPTSVNFGNVEWLEVPGGASNIFGYFKQFAASEMYHHPNPSWLGWNDSNQGLFDHASFNRWPKPWSAGGWQWNIPNKYRVTGEGGTGRVFVTTHQIFRITNKRGTSTVQKSGITVSRSP